MEEKKQEARARLLEVIKHLRYASKEASAEGKVQLGILSVKPEGGGRIVASMDAGSFIEDIALLIDAPEHTEDDHLEASAEAFLHRFGLR